MLSTLKKQRKNLLTQWKKKKSIYLFLFIMVTVKPFYRADLNFDKSSEEILETATKVILFGLYIHPCIKFC